MKCDYCESKAKRTSILYTLESMCHLPWYVRWKRKLKDSEFTRQHVCEMHYFMFHHGIETMVCIKCDKPTMMQMDYFYDMEKFYCAHCGELIEVN